MVNTKQKHPKSYIKSRALRRQAGEKTFETDSQYFLKLVVFTLLGTFWLKFAQPVSWFGIPFTGVPIGLLLGVILVHSFEKHQSDRKIWYAILLIVTIISNFIPAGVVI